MDYQAFAEDLVRQCREKGADAAEVFIESNRDLSIEIRNGEVETIQEAASQGVGFRVFVKGCMAFSNSNDLTKSSLDNTISSAIRFARNTTPDEHNVLPDDMGTSKVDGLYDPRLGTVPMEEKIELAKTVEKLAMRDSRITKSAGAGYGETESHVFLANSNGLSKAYPSTTCYFGVSVVAEKGDQKTSGGEYCSRRLYADLKAPEEIAAKAARSAYEMLDPGKVKTRKAAVIFDPDVAYAILGGIRTALNGEEVLQGASFLGDKLDQHVASDLVTLIDDGVMDKGLASAPFDGEGVPTKRRILIEGGFLRGFMYNTIVARRAGVKSTGNATRGGFNDLPDIGQHNFYIAAGTSTAEEIIRATTTGLWLKEVTGYGINPVNGHFSGGASGFWIENGKVAFPVKGLTIAGTAEEMLNGIDMVADDLDLNRSFTAPTLRIREMQIGGE